MQLVSRRSEAFNWVIGGYYFSSVDRLHPFSLKLSAPYFTPPGIQDLFQIDIRDRLSSRSLAAFAQGTLALAPGTNITGGIRYTDETRRLFGQEFGFADGFPVGEVIPAVRSSISAKQVTYRAAIDHKFAQDVMGYLSFNTGFKSGGFNGFDPTNPPYQPEKLTAYEAGLKTELLDRRLRLNLAAFYYDYTNIQVTRYITTALVYNGASARLYGGDLDIAWRATPELQITGGLELLSSKFLSFPNAQFSIPLPNGGIAPVSGDAAGNRLPYAAKVSASVSIDYSKQLASGVLDLNLTNAFNSGYPSEPDNRLRVGSFDLLSASIAYTPTGGRWNLRLYAKNLLNEV